MAFTTLIDTSTLEAHLSDPLFAVVDCRLKVDNETWGEREYLKEHVAGAAFVSVDYELSGPKTGRNGRHPLPDVDSLTRTLGKLGIAEGIQVVAYDQDLGMYASRLWWLLRWLGHTSVAVLDGGFAKWKTEERPVRTGVETHRTRSFAGTPRPGWIVTADSVAELVGRKDWLLVDARTPERYRGEVEPVDPVAGRIPGAANYPYQSNIGPEGTFRPPEELRQQLHDLVGNVPVERVVCYCGSGVTACQNLLALELAGMPGAKLYAGSWSEWCSDPARPIERS